MRGRVIVLAVSVFILLGLFGYTPAKAATLPYTCTVLMAGPSGSTGLVYFKLTDTASSPAFSEKFFKALAGRENQMLATALTALSSGMKVLIYASITQSGYPVISAMYLVTN